MLRHSPSSACTLSLFTRSLTPLGITEQLVRSFMQLWWRVPILSLVCWTQAGEKEVCFFNEGLFPIPSTQSLAWWNCFWNQKHSFWPCCLPDILDFCKNRPSASPMLLFLLDCYGSSQRWIWSTEWKYKQKCVETGFTILEHIKC